MEPECLCVCIIDEGLSSDERNDDIYAFIFWVGGGQGSCLYFWVMMFMFWHICAVSACKHEPFDCTVVSFLSLQVVQPIRTLGLMVFSVLVMREHSPATFVWVLFRDLTRVYLFENKICDSVMIFMCLLFRFKRLSGFGSN